MRHIHVFLTLSRTREETRYSKWPNDHSEIASGTLSVASAGDCGLFAVYRPQSAQVKQEVSDNAGIA